MTRQLTSVQAEQRYLLKKPHYQPTLEIFTNLNNKKNYSYKNLWLKHSCFSKYKMYL